MAGCLRWRINLLWVNRSRAYMWHACHSREGRHQLDLG
jgi:hypothetical protein